MAKRGAAAPMPLGRETMVSHFEEDRELIERRQRRSRLADDLLEDVIDDSDSDIESEDAPEEPVAAPLGAGLDLAEEEAPVARVATRTPLEIEVGVQRDDPVQSVSAADQKEPYESS